MVRHGFAIDQLLNQVYVDHDQLEDGLAIIAPDAADFVCAFLVCAGSLEGDHDIRTVRTALSAAILRTLEEQAITLEPSGLIPCMVRFPQEPVELGDE